MKGSDSKMLLEHDAYGRDEYAQRGARWAAQQPVMSDGYCTSLRELGLCQIQPTVLTWPPLAPDIERYKKAFEAFQGENHFKLNRARQLIQDLVAWPDMRELEQPDKEPASLADAPETLDLLDSFMQHLKQASKPIEQKDPFLLLLALRGYTEFASSSPAAEAQRAALEDRILLLKPTWWAAPDGADNLSGRQTSKLTGGSQSVYNPFNVPARLAGPMVLSADYIRRHALYAGREDLFSAWDGQAQPPPVEFHRQRLFRILASIMERMDEGGIISSNSSGLPDLPYNQVRSFIAPALLHAPEDPFVLLGALQLLAATFNTAVAGRTQAAMLIAGLDKLRWFHDRTGRDWQAIETIDLRALYEGAVAAFEVARPLLDGHVAKFQRPIRQTAKFIERREFLRAEAAEARARVQMEKRESAQPSVLDALVHDAVGARIPEPA